MPPSRAPRPWTRKFFFSTNLPPDSIPSSPRESIQLLLKLKEAFGITIIVVTHELASAFLIADRMVLLDKGHIVANGTPAELQASLTRVSGNFSIVLPNRKSAGKSTICKC